MQTSQVHMFWWHFCSRRKQTHMTHMRGTISSYNCILRQGGHLGFWIGPKLIRSMQLPVMKDEQGRPHASIICSVFQRCDLGMAHSLICVAWKLARCSRVLVLERSFVTEQTSLNEILSCWNCLTAGIWVSCQFRDSRHAWTSYPLWIGYNI